MPVSVKVNAAGTLTKTTRQTPAGGGAKHWIVDGLIVGIKGRAEKKSGRGPPTTLALRPQGVLTPPATTSPNFTQQGVELG